MTPRPSGVTALIVILLIIAVIGIIYGTISGSEFALSIPQVQLMSLMTPYFSAMLVYSGVPTSTALLYAYIISYFWVQSQVVLNQKLAVGIDILAIISITTVVGLFRMKRWGRYLALILGTIMLIGGLIGLIIIYGIIPFAFGLATVLYLRGDVKYEFQY